MHSAAICSTSAVFASASSQRKCSKHHYQACAIRCEWHFTIRLSSFCVRGMQSILTMDQSWGVTVGFQKRSSQSRWNSSTHEAVPQRVSAQPGGDCGWQTVQIMYVADRCLAVICTPGRRIVFVWQLSGKHAIMMTVRTANVFCSMCSQKEPWIATCSGYSTNA